MSMMTTTQDHTLALNIAPKQNQNTAPVFDFECLFTHDLLKKKKTWHDGTLRFHTFNRRLMVYDDSKNFVGDLHYRDTNELQEGTELRLDRGVLVDVGRRTGQTETDLADVLDKRGHGEDGARAKQAKLSATYQSTQRDSSFHSQGRPKSLAAVLGASQGPIGRARLAVKSPYEQLHEGHSASASVQRPAKRQRVTTGKENALGVVDLSHVAQQDNRQPRPYLSSALQRLPLTPRQEVNTARHVIEISSENDEPLSPAFRSASGTGRSRQNGTKSQRNPPAKLDLAPKPSKPVQRALPRLLSVVEPPAVPSNVQKKHRVAAAPARDMETSNVRTNAQKKRKKVTAKSASVQLPTSMSSEIYAQRSISVESATIAKSINLSHTAQGKHKNSILTDSSDEPALLATGPKASLRFAPQKPRKKLTYKALLPSSFVTAQPGTHTSTGAASAEACISADGASKPDDVSLRSTRPRCQPERVFDLSSPESVPNQQQQAVTPPRSIARSGDIPARGLSSSPSPCSQSPSKALPVRTTTEDDSTVPLPTRTPSPNPRSEIEWSADNAALEDFPAAVLEPDLVPHLSPVSKLTLMDQRLMMAPPRIEPSIPQSRTLTKVVPDPSLQLQEAAFTRPVSPPSRPFRRVLSESDSPAHASKRSLTLPAASRTQSVLTSMQPKSDVQTSEFRRPFKSPTKLQRSHSDTSAMLQVEMPRAVGRKSINVPKLVNEEEDMDVGPWSSREAFLLFEWWPPGREKPNYGSMVETEIRQQSFGGFTHPRNAESFGQPHGVIQDEVDI